MQVTRDHINDAVKRFLALGGEIKKIDHTVGEPVLGKDYLISEEILDIFFKSFGLIFFNSGRLYLCKYMRIIKFLLIQPHH